MRPGSYRTIFQQALREKRRGKRKHGEEWESATEQKFASEDGKVTKEQSWCEIKDAAGMGRISGTTQEVTFGYGVEVEPNLG